MKNLKALLTVVLISATTFSFAQSFKLHVNDRWSECSFQIDPSLTQSAWREFTREAGLVVNFRSLTDAKPIGAKKFEVALLQWQTGFDDTKPAWNNTFVHPDSTHWLKEGPRLAIPGLTLRVGLTDKLDVAVYWTKSPGANYGFYGSQLQYNLINNEERNLSTSARISFISMYGPEDINLSSYGFDLVTSKEFELFNNKLMLSPYVVLSTYASSSHEKTESVDLKDEKVVGIQCGVGMVAKFSVARLAVEYNAATLNTISFKLGVGF